MVTTHGRQGLLGTCNEKVKADNKPPEIMPGCSKIKELFVWGPGATTDWRSHLALAREQGVIWQCDLWALHSEEALRTVGEGRT